MLITTFIYVSALLICSQWVSKPFQHQLTIGNGESRTLIVLIIASFFVLTWVADTSMKISERYVQELRNSLSHEIATQVLVFSTVIAGVTAVVILLLQYAMYHTAQLRHEATLRTVIAEQKEQQYATLQENIAIINRNAHNLKHQIAALEYAPQNRRASMVAQVQQAITTYDAVAHTGNDALDTLFTERGFYCAHHNIRLTVMLGGCDFSKFDVVDMFTLFGNALDNAIEYVSGFDDKSKRVIAISGTQRGNVITISFDNPLDRELTMGEKLPKTTKQESFIHGIGLQSIRQIAQHYGGDILVQAAPPLFTLQVSLLVP